MITSQTTVLPLGSAERAELGIGAGRKSVLTRLMGWLGLQPTWVRLTLTMAIVACCGWLDADTGWEVSLFVFYALPIALAVWTIGSEAGYITALVSSAVWWFANRNENPYVTELGYAWAMMNRLVYFAFVAYGVKAIRNKQESDAAQIQMLNEMRQLEAEIISVSEHEQQRIGQDLHDGICQQLAAIGCAARLLADELKETDHPGQEDAVNIEAALRASVGEARSLARGIFPVHVDRTGLVAALGELVESTSRLTGVSVTLESVSDIQIGAPEVAMHLYRIAQEAVANAVKHGEATEVCVSLAVREDHLTLGIKDNGCGLKASQTATQTGMGLRTMRHRARAVGGIVHVNAVQPHGTCVVCRLKVKEDKRHE